MKSHALQNQLLISRGTPTLRRCVGERGAEKPMALRLNRSKPARFPSGPCTTSRSMRGTLKVNDPVRSMRRDGRCGDPCVNPTPRDGPLGTGLALTPKQTVVEDDHPAPYHGNDHGAPPHPHPRKRERWKARKMESGRRALRNTRRTTAPGSDRYYSG